MKKYASLVILSFGLLGCAGPSDDATRAFVASTTATAAPSGPQDAGGVQQEFLALLEDEQTYRKAQNPGFDIASGKTVVPNHFAPVDAQAHAARYRAYGDFKKRLNAVDRSALDAESQLNFDLFAFYIESQLLFEKHKTWRIPFYSDSGFHTAPSRAWRTLTFKSREDYQRYIAWLRDLPRHFHDHQANLEQGLRDGFTMPRIVIDGLLPSFDALVTAEAEQHPLFGPFANMPTALKESLSQQDREALLAEAKAVMQQHVLPAYAALARFMRDVYHKQTRTSIAASEMPGGAAYYADMVKYYTTLDVSPEEVHQVGLSEVKRIRGEMDAIIKRLDFDGSFADFLAFLRTDPRFYAKTPNELLMRASAIAKRIDIKMPSLFGQLPRQPYGVEAVPASIAPNYTTGRYVGAPLGAPRGGIYWVNTYNLGKRPLYVLPSLTLHEAVPGHHHQIALSLELQNVPAFRKGLYPHAFGEGWGLYAEKLGVEMGIYQTPYEDFGRLTYEMWRACRLVVDTGMHAFGWTRQQAQDCLLVNSALSSHNVRTEVDRYISWPGQALAYKMGELTFLRLRQEAETALGDRFDIRTFHDKALGAGGVPLSILEARIRQWIAAQN